MSGLTITIAEQECAIIVAQDGDGLIVRIESSEEPEAEDGAEEAELPIAKLLGLAIATRLTEDPDFMEEMLDWFDDYTEDHPEG
ncbi:MAG: hypothetical protein EXR07_01185 [Acetobacteraceae bacterium]|nr:hypothetical protein [Acetobacteraceae bacterium]